MNLCTHLTSGRTAAVLLACMFSGAFTAQGQALPAARGPNSSIVLGGSVSAFQADYGQRILGGAQIYTDVNPTWRYGFEGEARYLRLNTDENVTQTDYLAGVRVALRPWGIQPYAKLLVGAGRITLPFHYAQGTFFTYAPGGGVDLTLSDRWSARLLDVEYQLWPGFSFGELRPYGISAGIRFRLNDVPEAPDSWRPLRR